MNTKGILGRQLIGILVAAFMVVGCTTMDQGSSQTGDRLVTAQGTVVEVPRYGMPGFNSMAQKIAQQVRELDDALALQQTSSLTAPPMAEETLSILKAARDDAIEDLARAYRISKRTSGTLDDQLLTSASRDLQDLLEVAREPRHAAKFDVVTNITSEVGAIIHYVSVAEYDRSNKPFWESYTKGQVLRVGRYIFRVRPANPSRNTFVQRVSILRDPYVKVLAPTGD